MPKKGMRSILFKPNSSPSHSHRPSPSPTATPPRSFPASPMEDHAIDAAHSLITKWDGESSAYAKVTSLFYDNRGEAMLYLRAVKDLHSAMHSFAKQDSTSDRLLRSQLLMQTAMKRLQKEFYQILAANRECLDPESVSVRSSRPSVTGSSISDFEEESVSDDEFRAAGESITEVERLASLAMADLKAIADCMISTGYGKECVKIYKVIRKSIIDEGLYHLGVERLSASQINKMDWEVVELKIKHWLYAVKTAVKTLFYGERILCDHVFSSSDSIRESCFAEISKEGAISLFAFPELVAKCKKSPEKMFRTLDLYEAISDNWPEIESIFYFESTAFVRSQAITSLIKLSESVRTMLSDLEAAIQKDNSKSPLRGGGAHPLTRYVMNYLDVLADYSGVLSDIVTDWPLKMHSPLPESYFGSPSLDDAPTSAISVQIAWIILVLLCKLDGRAELYNDVSLSYIFLANNLQYVVNKVRASNLVYILGDDWVTRHEAKVKQYTANYKRMGWSKVLASLPENPTAAMSPEEARERLKNFNAAFEEAYRKQTAWVVTDPKLRDEIKRDLARQLVPTFREFYEKYRGAFRGELLVRFAPDDLDNYVSDLFYGMEASGSTSSSSSPSLSPSPTPSGSSHSRLWRFSR
ncbi:exocyst complex component EXO70H1 [Malania oleifera]|uniref:exocyst complex component EXO70H1 n=1 Tax=Malania oleifera TaxID=397392 RepID=UPI0025ADA94F|nr:exocyst complex component EXO70H1 [Malania oleifera]